MTSPRSTYGGGYYSSPSFPDTPIYDKLVAERGTPQIAPIRVSLPYDNSGHLPALPSSLPALPAAPSHQTPPHGHPAVAPQPAGLQQAPAPYIPQQAPAPRGYPGGQQAPGPRGYPGHQQQPQPHPQQPYQQRPVPPAGYEGVRPAAPRPAAPRPAPAPYDDPYGPGQGQHQYGQRTYPGQGY